VDSPEAVCTAQLGSDSYESEAVTSGTVSQLARPTGKESIRFREVARKAKFHREATNGSLNGVDGADLDVTIISEGPGNLADRHWYSREAVMSGQKVFEGAACFLDHPDAISEQTQPERSVRDEVGYYYGCRAVEVNGLMTLKAKLHLKEGCEAANEARATAKLAQDHIARYGEADPTKKRPGISINADGEDQPGEINGETWNVVKVFTEATSADIVTFPAARGGFSRALESARSALAGGNAKEAAMKVSQFMKESTDAVRKAVKKMATTEDAEKRAQIAAEAEGYMKAMDEIEAKAAGTEGDIHITPDSSDKDGQTAEARKKAAEEDEAKKKATEAKAAEEAAKKAAEEQEESRKRAAEEDNEAGLPAMTPVKAAQAAEARTLREAAAALPADKADVKAKLEARATALEGSTGDYSKLRERAHKAETKAFVLESTMRAQTRLAEAGLSSRHLPVLIGKTHAEQDAIISMLEAARDEAIALVSGKIEGAGERIRPSQSTHATESAALVAKHLK
jgi:hypothetical protein